MFRRTVLVLALACLPLAIAPYATAAAPVREGRIGTAYLDVFDHRVVESGWAYDPARPAASIVVSVYFNGRYAGAVWANRPSVGLDRARHIGGRHGFLLARAWSYGADSTRVVTHPSNVVVLDRAVVRHVMPPAGTRIIIVARRYVGRSPYVWGGASPRGFDCSGYTMYAYAHAWVRSLPHNAEMQRRVHGMRLISRYAARPGDLIFYMSGGYAYHVAIYAGNGWQYAAVAPGLGVRHQRVPWSGVQFRTILH